MIWAWRVGEREIWACWVEEVVGGVDIIGVVGRWCVEEVFGRSGGR